MSDLQDHHIQILSNFIFKTEAERHEIDFKDFPTHELDDHINHLVLNGYLLTDDTNKIFVTSKGKDIAGRLDFMTAKIEKQPKTVMAAMCRKIENGEEKTLMHLRLENPYYGFLGFPTGTSKFGNIMSEDVVRELEEETGLTGTPILKEIKHMLVRTRDTGEFMDDVVMYAFEIINPTGTLIEKNIEGENYWMTLDEIKNYPKVSLNTLDTMKSLNSHGVVFIEEIQEYDTL